MRSVSPMTTSKSTITSANSSCSRAPRASTLRPTKAKSGRNTKKQSATKPRAPRIGENPSRSIGSPRERRSAAAGTRRRRRLCSRRKARARRWESRRGDAPPICGRAWEMRSATAPSRDKRRIARHSTAAKSSASASKNMTPQAPPRIIDGAIPAKERAAARRAMLLSSKAMSMSQPTRNSSWRARSGSA